MKTVRIISHWCWIAALGIGLGSCALSVVPTNSEDKQIFLELFAIPNRATEEDTVATAEIWATLRRGTSPVRDSTLVVFASTVGTISPTGLTQDGLAVALLRVSFPRKARPPTGVIVAQALTVRDTLDIDFVTFGE